ncbi:MAG: enoyl-CoA hydratase/isomerase family protein [Bacteroidetes bacterium]|nr:enoyl-CoA hydratase/isomerase family protein [Bacteroidota bacterium]
MSDALQQGYIKSDLIDGIAHIEFFHPLSNSLPSKLLSELADAISEAGKNEAVKVLLLRSAGERAFCAGASFDELISIQDLDQGKKFFSGFANVINAMRTCPKFIVGRVHGKAVGGAVGLASSVDYCFATKHASVKLSELAVGIGPFVVGPAVERKVGLSGMSELAINATEWRDAEWAHQRGLYYHLHESAEEMDQEIEALLTRLKGFNPEAMRQLKEVFWQGTEHWDQLLADRAAISGELVLSDFTRNAINAFKKK